MVNPNIYNTADQHVAAGTVWAVFTWSKQTSLPEEMTSASLVCLTQGRRGLGRRFYFSGGGKKNAWGLEEAPYLAEAIEEHVEVREDGASGHLHDVVEGLTSVVPQPTVGVVEARQHRLDQLLQVEPGVLRAGGGCLLRSTPQGEGRGGTATGPRNQQIWGVWLPTDSSRSWPLSEAALGLSFQGEISAASLSHGAHS